jgi:hypothetical protein
MATSMSASTHHDASVHVRPRPDRGSPHVRMSATPCDAVTSSTVSSGEGIQWQHQGGSKSDTKSDLSQHYSLLHFLSRPRMHGNGLPREPAADLDVYRGHRRSGIGTCLKSWLIDVQKLRVATNICMTPTKNKLGRNGLRLLCCNAIVVCGQQRALVVRSDGQRCCQARG